MNLPTEVHRDLIFDLGVNHGEDTEFYLAKGFRVVGVEADPRLVEELTIVYADPLADGRMILEPVGLMDAPGVLPFYRNITCDHWSSFVKEYGCRGDTEFEIVEVPCITIAELFRRHGCPHYMKIDIEGADRIILEALVNLDIRPTFVSVEEFGLGTIDALHSVGYDRFSIRSQLDKSWASAVRRSREGAFVEREFTQRDSGVFGLDVPEWLTYEEAVETFHRRVRSPSNEWLPPPGEWYDVHATVWSPALDEVASGG
mgnify:CR=1 FL=1